MSTFEQIKSLEDAFQLKTYAKYPIAVETGKGAYVTDTEGKRYLDFYGGHAVAITGHCHPKIVAAITEQASKLLFYSNIVYSEVRAKAAEAVVSLAPEGLTKVFFCNSGTEANEAAIKIARKYTGKTTIISMHQGFHGRTHASMSITGFAKYRQFPPFMGGVSFAEFGNIESVLAAIEEAKGDVAGVILEPVQSMAGVRIAPPTYYQSLRQLCDDHGIVLIFDEVQTGFGRCGVNFFGDAVDIKPDLITCAKGMASGIPIGGVLLKDEIAATIQLGEHGTTFGGGPLACAAAMATAQVIKEEELAQKARSVGAYVAEKLTSAGIKGLSTVRGIGLLIGIEFETEAKGLLPILLKKGVIIGSSEDPKTLRLLPPLVVNEKDSDVLVSAMADASKDYFK